jgi:hypothetical protein
MPEEDAEMITNYTHFITNMNKMAPRHISPVSGKIVVSYICHIGSVTEEEIRNGDYIKLPDTPAARVLYSTNKP